MVLFFRQTIILVVRSITRCQIDSRIEIANNFYFRKSLINRTFVDITVIPIHFKTNVTRRYRKTKILPSQNINKNKSKKFDIFG
jgi:hypothetical protein